MRRLEGLRRRYFTDLDGRFQGRLARVVPTRREGEGKLAGISAKYDCRVKVEYQKDLMGLLEEGMLLAVENFKSSDDEPRYTLLEVSRVWPEHYGLRGLSDSGYYPMQFEVIEQSEEDWRTDDTSTMMIQLSTIPINHDLVFQGEPTFEKGFSYPVIGSEAEILNEEMVNQMYNQEIVEKLGVDTSTTTRDAKADPRVGVIKMFEARGTDIPLYLDYESLLRYHFGVFSFTGGGKSNQVSNLIRRVLYHTTDTRVVIFDISSEYAFLLMDVLADQKVPSKLITEGRVSSVERLSNSVVKPRDFEDDPRVEEGLKRVLDLDRVGRYVKPASKPPTYGEVLSQLGTMRKDNLEKPHYVDAIDQIRDAVASYVAEGDHSERDEVSEDFIEHLAARAEEAVRDFGVHEASGLYNWATSRHKLRDVLRRRERIVEAEGYSLSDLRNLVEEETRLLCVSISDPAEVKDLAIRLTRDMLQRRKASFKVKPQILFVFDEAQEFIPSTSESTGIDRRCSRAVETLLRQGRKYGLGGCVATQRIAHLNTNALQQLHTYFVGTLPRPYDRNVVSRTFMIDQGILEKTLEFAPGDWLLSSYIATGMENVPIFVHADDTEKEIEDFLAAQADS